MCVCVWTIIFLSDTTSITPYNGQVRLSKGTTKSQVRGRGKELHVFIIINNRVMLRCIVMAGGGQCVVDISHLMLLI